MDYVNQESLKIAHEMERKLAGRASSAGLLFVSVTPVPAENGHATEYMVVVGVERARNERATRVVVLHALEAEMSVPGRVVRVEVYRGVSGVRQNDGAGTTRSL